MEFVKYKRVLLPKLGRIDRNSFHAFHEGLPVSLHTMKGDRIGCIPIVQYILVKDDRFEYRNLFVFVQRSYGFPLVYKDFEWRGIRYRAGIVHEQKHTHLYVYVRCFPLGSRLLFLRGSCVPIRCTLMTEIVWYFLS